MDEDDDYYDPYDSYDDSYEDRDNYNDSSWNDNPHVPCPDCGACLGCNERHFEGCAYSSDPNLELDYLTRPEKTEDKINNWIEEIVEWFDGTILLKEKSVRK